jgi:hypothetical protein
LRAYALAARTFGFNEDYIQDVLGLATEFERYRLEHGTGDPDRGRHRKDDAATVKEMQAGHGS